jgi:C4-type Zn-finger protein
MEDPEEGVLFEEQSQEIKCPYCDTSALSIVEYRNNVLGYLVSLILLFTLGWLSF